jgi:anthranilate/para-aminobenzoate synthase component I
VNTLVIDNYDSFTWNLVHYLAEANQEEPLVLCNDQTSWREISALSIDNIVISPGPGRPDRTDDFGVCAEVIAKSRLPVPAADMPNTGGVPGPIRFALDRDRATYLNDVERCLEWIRDGESYQVCLSNEIVAQVSVNALDLYRVLRRVNPAPHAAFLQWPGGAVLSASPERFLSVDAEGRVEAKPIKGTLGRSTPQREFAEMLLKAEASIRAIVIAATGAFELERYTIEGLGHISLTKSYVHV